MGNLNPNYVLLLNAFRSVAIPRKGCVYTINVLETKHDACHGARTTKEGLVYVIRIGSTIREM